MFKLIAIFGLVALATGKSQPFSSQLSLNHGIQRETRELGRVNVRIKTKLFRERDSALNYPQSNLPVYNSLAFRFRRYPNREPEFNTK